jgi:NADH:ubiquinone oxidoreductase subunit K
MAVMVEVEAAVAVAVLVVFYRSWRCIMNRFF